jgi:thiamine biosynthesis lipoprotein
VLLGPADTPVDVLCGRDDRRPAEAWMGTAFTIDVRGRDGDPSAIGLVTDWMRWVDSVFSPLREDSDVARLRDARTVLAETDPAVTAVLRRCEQVRDRTDGWFDHTARGGLDPSAYVIGWAIDRASALLSAHGVLNHCISTGHVTRCRGSARPRAGWCIGLTDPLRPGRLIARVRGAGLATATAGPATHGRPFGAAPEAVRPGLSAVTIVGRNLSGATALAEAAYSTGDTAGAWLAARGVVAVLVRSDGSTGVTSSRCR